MLLFFSFASAQERVECVFLHLDVHGEMSLACGEDERQVVLRRFMALDLLGDLPASVLSEWRGWVSDLLETKPVRFMPRGVDVYDLAYGDLSVDMGSGYEDLFLLLLRRGLAVYLPLADSSEANELFYAAESAAVKSNLGLWAYRDNFVFAADELDILTDLSRRRAFAIVSGRVYETAIVRGRLYINFAADWRRDFTVSASSSLHKSFNYDFAALAGRSVEARGFLHRRHGPQIDLSGMNFLRLPH